MSKGFSVRGMMGLEESLGARVGPEGSGLRLAVSLLELRESFPPATTTNSLLLRPASFCEGGAVCVSETPPPPPPPPPGWGAAGGWKEGVTFGAGEMGLVGAWDGDWAPLMGLYLPSPESVGVVGVLFFPLRRRLRKDDILLAGWLAERSRGE